MTRNRDHMSVADMLRVCTMSGAAILAGMVMLGIMMIAHKPELGLELASTPIQRVAPIIPLARPDVTIEVSEAVAQHAASL